MIPSRARAWSFKGAQSYAPERCHRHTIMITLVSHSHVSLESPTQPAEERSGRVPRCSTHAPVARSEQACGILGCRQQCANEQ
jgi:hypothetical protein